MSQATMTQASPSDYWISPSAISITRNALGNPDYIQASVLSGSTILVYVKSIIDYDNGHNYRRWKLQAAPTVFADHREKYLYAAIPRTDTATDQNALLVYPSELIDIYGCNADGEQIGATDRYYIFLQGILSSSGDNGTTNRIWQQEISTGYLASDEALSAGPTDTVWYRYSNVSDLLTFLKDLTMKAGTVFREFFGKAVTIVSGGNITFEGQQPLYGVATDDTDYKATDRIATPKTIDDKALSKCHDDQTKFDITLKSLRANGNIDCFGNLTIGSPEQLTTAQINGTLNVGTFNKGIAGGNIDFYGNAEFESIVARSFLEVPELRYNRTTITVGNKWQTQGAGLIEKVWTGNTLAAEGLTAYEGIAKLKLEDGEIGAIAIDDKCQGVYHFTTKKNDASTTDSKDGNFHFAGFTTIYFLVTEIYTADTLPAAVRAQLDDDETIGSNQFFRYELRARTCATLPAENRNRWTDDSHPQPSLNFAAYANATNSDRQRSRLTTTTYQLHLAGMTNWTYTQDNIQLILGWLDGFSLLQRVWDKEKKQYVETTKELNGEGIATGNIYMWGSVDQFDRAPSLVAQQLYFHASNSVSTVPDGIIIASTSASYNLNGWTKDPITPSATDRVVWQQWLYTYADGTYAVSEVAFNAADPTALTARLSKNIISVAISDWYDAAHADTIQFDLDAELLSGTQPVALTGCTATYADGTSTTTSLSYTTDYNADQTRVTFHIAITGYVGIEVDGATPEDAYVNITLESAYGTAAAAATIAQNREGEKGDTGEQGAAGKQGVRGYTGVTVRRSEWEEGVYYRNDNADGSEADDGNRYLDEVSVTSLATGEAQWFIAKEWHNGRISTADNKPTLGGNDYWTPLNDMRPIRTSFADIMTAFVKYLQVNQIQIVDDNNTPYGAFGGGTDNPYPLWFGGETADKAVVKFDREGNVNLGDNLTVQDGNVSVKGEVNATSGTFQNGTFTNVDITGSIRCNIETVISLFNAPARTDVWALKPNYSGYFGWAPKSDERSPIGRTIKLVHFVADGILQTGTVTISLTDGTYFYEDGIKKTSLRISNQIVTIFGFGEKDNLYGFVVLNREDFYTSQQYGHPLRCLAVGNVTVNSATDIQINSNTFDGSTMTLTRNGVGHYTITHEEWFSDAGNSFVMACGLGNVVGGKGITPSKATVDNETSTTFDIYTSDDDSCNDGSFRFMIYNFNDFSILHAN